MQEGVLADYSDSETDSITAQRAQERQRGQQMRRVRAHGSPEGRGQRTRGKIASYEDEQGEFVNRQPDGGFLLGVSGGSGAAVPAMSVPRTEEEGDQDGEVLPYVCLAGRMGMLTAVWCRGRCALCGDFEAVFRVWGQLGGGEG